jgi:DNA-damage-inducible protein D
MSNKKLFEEKKVRSVYNEQEEKWYFSVQDDVQILADSNDVKQYIKKSLLVMSSLKTNAVQFVP